MKKLGIVSLCIILSITRISLIAEEEKDNSTKSTDTGINNSAEVSSQTLQTIEKGLEHFSQCQLKNGSISGNYPIAGTALIGLCWLASGNTPQRGKYSGNIRHALNYIIRSQLKSGFICGQDNQSGMYGHGYGTLFLAEAFGMIEDASLYEEARDALKKAVRLLENTQNRYGGWNAAPDAQATDDGSGAIAIMQITALRAARNAGVSVKTGTIERTKKYLLEMTNENGWYQYNYGSRGGSRHSSALTGAGMYMLGAMDLYTEPKYEKGIRNILNSAPFLGGNSQADEGWSGWYYYAAFYSSLAIYQYGGADWSKWYAAIREDLIKRQSSDGSWTGDHYGGIFSAFAILTLQLPYRYLPIFQEGGRGAEGK